MWNVKVALGLIAVTGVAATLLASGSPHVPGIDETYVQTSATPASGSAWLSRTPTVRMFEGPGSFEDGLDRLGPKLSGARGWERRVNRKGVLFLRRENGRFVESLAVLPSKTPGRHRVLHESPDVRSGIGDQILGLLPLEP